MLKQPPLVVTQDGGTSGFKVTVIDGFGSWAFVDEVADEDEPVQTLGKGNLLQQGIQFLNTSMDIAHNDGSVTGHDQGLRLGMGGLLQEDWRQDDIKRGTGSNAGAAEYLAFVVGHQDVSVLIVMPGKGFPVMQKFPALVLGEV